MFNQKELNQEYFNSLSMEGAPVYIPDLTFRSNIAPYNILSSINFIKTAPSYSVLPVLHGETSDKIAFRLYNNFNLKTGISTAINLNLTTFDSVAMNTASKSVCAQQWIRVYQHGFGLDSMTPGLYTYWKSDYKAIGGDVNIFYPDKGSDGLTFPEIAAGTDTNGCGFIEFTVYAEIPKDAIAESVSFALVASYDFI